MYAYVTKTSVVEATASGRRGQDAKPPPSTCVPSGAPSKRNSPFNESETPQPTARVNKTVESTTSTPYTLRASSPVHCRAVPLPMSSWTSTPPATTQSELGSPPNSRTATSVPCCTTASAESSEVKVELDARLTR